MPETVKAVNENERIRKVSSVSYYQHRCLISMQVHSSLRFIVVLVTPLRSDCIVFLFVRDRENIFFPEPADCEVHYKMCFMSASNVKPTKVYRHLRGKQI